MNNIRFYKYPGEGGKYFDARTKDYYLRPIQDNVLIGYGEGGIDATNDKVSSTLSNQSANKDSVVSICLDKSMLKELTFRFSIEGYDTFPSVFDGLSFVSSCTFGITEDGTMENVFNIPVSNDYLNTFIDKGQCDKLPGTIVDNEYVIPLASVDDNTSLGDSGQWTLPFKLELPYTYDAYKLFFGGNDVLSIQMSLTNTDGTIKYTDVRILGNTQNLLYFNPKHGGVSAVMRLFEFESGGSIGDKYGIHTPQDLRNFKYPVAAETFFAHTETNQEYFLKDSSYA